MKRCGSGPPVGVSERRVRRMVKGAVCQQFDWAVGS
jgi:hypothetical protein